MRQSRYYCTSTLRTGDSATPPAKKEKLIALDMLLGPEQLSQNSTLENELKNYLAEAPIPRKENPLAWWKANANPLTRIKLQNLKTWIPHVI